MFLKKYYHFLIREWVSYDGVWAWISATLVRLVVSLQNARKDELVRRKLHPFIPDVITLITPDLRVKNGPFQGMSYPSAMSAGSALFPKLLGSYERELHPLIENICTKSYNLIIDIGCAEGYYAVGFARRLRKAQILAYDIECRARELCATMATLNGVSDRVTIKAECSPLELASLSLPACSLIICDCEGYEMTLFSPEIAALMTKVDFLIEVHDFIDIEISAAIRKRFEATHEIAVIQSVDDLQKPYHKDYAYPELISFNAASRRILLAEYRPSIMEWFFMTPR
ncbi:hypothetical protein BH11VER1_BH11VER1_10810 [soil metagenome]